MTPQQWKHVLSDWRHRQDWRRTTRAGNRTVDRKPMLDTDYPYASADELIAVIDRAIVDGFVNSAERNAE